MAGFFEIAGLEQRKRALAAESEIFRETLKLEVQNLRLYSIGLRRRVGVVSSLAPLLMLTPAILRMFSKTRARTPKRNLLGKVLFAWRIYRQFSPFLLSFVGRKPSTTLSNPANPAQPRAES